MLTLKIAVRNIFRNSRRSLTTLSTISIGAAAVLVFGAYITYIQYGVQTGAVQLAAVVTPIQSLAGIAGNFDNNTSKTFFGVGFVPSGRDQMKLWDEYGTGSQGLKRSGLRDDDLSKGITGIGLVRILGLCERLRLDDCSAAPKVASDTTEPSGVTESSPPDLADLAGRDKPAGEIASAEPTIDLLAVTAGGAPNVVSLRITRVESQPLKELDDNYVGMNFGLAQNLIYGRGEHKASGIVVQLNRTEDLKIARARLLGLFKERGLNLGSKRSDFGSLPQAASVLLKVTRYFGGPSGIPRESVPRTKSGPESRAR